MSNVDRYRPPREAYQPPTSLPPKPPPTILDRPSKSPSRRRDVPPAVPSPPAYSSRTSPPRPLSRRSAPSPAHSSPRQGLQARSEQWLFTPEEVVSTPSIIDGLSVSEERLRRAKGVNFIYQAGVMLRLPQITLWVAGVFFHRFFMRYSMIEEKGGLHHYNIAATALFLANKTEENCRKTKDLIIAVGKVAQKNSNAIIDEASKEYWRWRDTILTFEEVMLEMLTWDLSIDTPYKHLYNQLRAIKKDDCEKFRDKAWAFCNDACLTVVPLLLPARDIATSAIFFAATTKNEPIDDIGGEPWWRFLGGNEQLMHKAISIIVEFYAENPLKKQDSKLQPGSPEFNLESTRRPGENTGHGSSQVGTPMGTDGGMQSPSRLNGREDHQSSDTGGKEDTLVKKEEAPTNPITTIQSIEMASQVSRGDSDAALKQAANEMSSHKHADGDGLRSPDLTGFKRKSVEMDMDSDGERDAKKARLADEDEGEIR